MNFFLDNHHLTGYITNIRGGNNSPEAQKKINFFLDK